MHWAPFGYRCRKIGGNLTSRVGIRKVGAVRVCRWRVDGGLRPPRRVKDAARVHARLLVGERDGARHVVPARHVDVARKPRVLREPVVVRRRRPAAAADAREREAVALEAARRRREVACGRDVDRRAADEVGGHRERVARKEGAAAEPVDDADVKAADADCAAVLRRRELAEAERGALLEGQREARLVRAARPVGPVRLVAVREGDALLAGRKGVGRRRVPAVLVDPHAAEQLPGDVLDARREHVAGREACGRERLRRRRRGRRGGRGRGRERRRLRR